MNAIQKCWSIVENRNGFIRNLKDKGSVNDGKVEQIKGKYQTNC